MHESRYPRPVLMLSLVFASLLSWWLSQPPQSPDTPAPNTPRHIPDYFVRDLQVIETGTTGQPAKAMKTRELIHYLDDGTSTLESPLFTLYSPGKPPWEIQADNATLSADGSTAELNGRVTVIRAAGKHSLPYKMVTSNLTLDIEDQYMETSQPVDIKSIRNRTRSIGMKGWLSDNMRIQFLSQVRGLHVPK